jgi:CheY-like chemotaxis protein
MASKPSVLVVDDEVNVATTLRLVLEREGYDVSLAFSCAEALMRLNDGSIPDAVITDLNMEREDIGLEVARFALSLHPPPVVVVCTGYANVDNSAAALRLRVDYLATKPVEILELRNALARLIARRAASLEGRR